MLERSEDTVASNINDVEHERAALQWLADHDRFVRYLCRLSCRGRYDLIDDLYEICVDRISSIVSRYDENHPSQATLFTHIHKSLKWYLWKYMNKLMKQNIRFSQLADAHVETMRAQDDAVKSIDDCDEVYSLLKLLHIGHRVAIVEHDLHGKTFQEISEATGVPKNTVRFQYHAARRALDEAIANQDLARAFGFTEIAYASAQDEHSACCEGEPFGSTP